MRVWYRHSGQAKIDGIPDDFRCKKVSEAEIAVDVGDNHITHLKVDGEIPAVDGSHITHLRIGGLADGRQLDR